MQYNVEETCVSSILHLFEKFGYMVVQQNSFFYLFITEVCVITGNSWRPRRMGTLGSSRPKWRPGLSSVGRVQDFRCLHTHAHTYGATIRLEHDDCWTCRLAVPSVRNKPRKLRHRGWGNSRGSGNVHNPFWQRVSQHRIKQSHWLADCVVLKKKLIKQIWFGLHSPVYVGVHMEHQGKPFPKTGLVFSQEQGTFDRIFA